MKYLLAIFLGCSVVCGILAYYYHTKANSYCELWKNSQANADFLIQKRREDNEKAMEASLRQEQLEELVKLSDEPCWNRVIPADDSVLVFLHKN